MSWYYPNCTFNAFYIISLYFRMLTKKYISDPTSMIIEALLLPVLVINIRTRASSNLASIFNCSLAIFFDEFHMINLIRIGGHEFINPFFTYKIISLLNRALNAGAVSHIHISTGSKMVHNRACKWYSLQIRQVN